MKQWWLIGPMMLFIWSCTEQPYIHDPGKYKSVTNYTKVVSNRDNVVLCSNSPTSAMRDAIAQEAKTECARFGKYAQYKRTTLATCPLSQPISWHYDCTTPKIPEKETSSK